MENCNADEFFRFPVSVVTAHHWGKSEDLLRNTRNGNELLVDGKRAPRKLFRWDDIYIIRSWRNF